MISGISTASAALARVEIEAHRDRIDKAKGDIIKAHDDCDAARAQEKEAEDNLAKAQGSSENASWWQKTFGEIGDVAGAIGAVAAATAAVVATGGVAAAVLGAAAIAGGVTAGGAKAASGAAGMAKAGDDHEADVATIHKTQAANQQQLAGVHEDRGIDEVRGAGQEDAQRHGALAKMQKDELEFRRGILSNMVGA